jgi:ankyrin repeat protein
MSMSSVNPKLLIAFVIVILFVVFLKVSNPYRKYSTSEYWEDATLGSIDGIPDDALEPGNKNGAILMWASMFSNNPDIIRALVARGADINESDGILMGTPISGAAGYASNPDVIDVLVELGADVNKKVNNNEDALMVAAQFNTEPEIIERLVYHGADPKHKNLQGKTALDLAKQNKNATAIQTLEKISEG